jgi:heptosyltransferase I
MLPPDRPPRTVCILRLSALGDTCHVVPVLRTLQRAWPETRFTWVIGKAEARLMSLVEGVEFITVDKRAGLLKTRRNLRTQLAGRRFDVLLHMQLAIRASLIAQAIDADVKVGFDRARAREMQWLFTNAQIEPHARQHVLDGFFGFPEALGVRDRTLRWDIPLPAEALEYAARLVPDARPTLVISPCSSHLLRNWSAERYAAIAARAMRRHGMRVILAGGPSAIEKETGTAIEHALRASGSIDSQRDDSFLNQIGQDTLPQLLALLARATALISPDSGPAHMATMVGTPVIGLYAASRSQRSGPYLSLEWCVDCYSEAARRFRGRAADELPWTEKIEEPGVMDLIPVDAVAAKLDELLALRR